MPLFKFSISGVIQTETFAADLSGVFPALSATFERSGYFFDAELLPELSAVFCTFGFYADFEAPFASFSARMQDEFYAYAAPHYPVIAAEFVTNSVFIASLVAAFPTVSTSHSFDINLDPGMPRLLSRWIAEVVFNTAITSGQPDIAASFIAEKIFSCALSTTMPVCSGLFVFSGSSFEAGIITDVPVCSGQFAVPGEISFGSETDVVLRHSYSRRYI